jgi:hypothetical protein
MRFGLITLFIIGICLAHLKQNFYIVLYPNSLLEMKDIPITESRPMRQVMRYAIISIMSRVYSIMQATKYTFTLLFIINILILPAHCIIGYDIIATVDSTKWIIHRYTENMLFSKEENIVGKGNFSRYRQISNIAGMNTKEQSYSLGGDLSHEEKLLMRTSEGPVVITIGLVDYFMHDDENDTENVTIDVNSSVDISIDEKWPAYFADYKTISYLGPGITARDYYDNNGDVVSNSLSSWKLSKQSYYRGYLNRTLIDVHIAPGSAIETRYRNSSSRYSLLQDSVGEKTNLGIVRQRMYTDETKFVRPEVYQTISQDYVGQQKIALSIDMANIVDRVKFDDARLDCCFGGYLSMPESHMSGESGFGSNLTRIFDCTCYQLTA